MDDVLIERLAHRVADAVVAALRANYLAAEPPAAITGDEAFALDIAAHEVIVHGERVRLKAREFALLSVLAKRPGRVYTREELLAAAWRDDVVLTVDDGAVDVHVARLRRRFGHRRIRTVSGVGYALEAGDQ